MEIERTKLLELAVSPQTGLSKVKAALGVLVNEPKKDEREGLLDAREAQKYLRLSRSTLWRLRRQGLPVVKLGGRILFRQKDLDRFVEKFIE